MKKNLSIRILRLFTAFCILAVTTTYFMGTTFGWFTMNEDVDGNQMSPESFGGSISIKSVTLNNEPVQIVNNRILLAVTGFEPGESADIVFNIEIYNDLDFIRFELLAPNGCDTPVVLKGENYYFGSQITITKFILQPDSPTPEQLTPKFELANAPLNSPLVPNGWKTSNTVTPTDISLHQMNGIKKGTYKLTLQLTFVNADFDQEVLKNFGKPLADGTPSGQTCYRQFFVSQLRRN